ncbi:MAG: alpha/beta hydrolase [Planctomycetaceae bacterium]
MRIAFALSLALLTSTAAGQDNIPIWPGMAPGETSDSKGKLLPARSDAANAVQRVVDVRRPTMDIFPAKKPNGTAVLVLPGGGFTYVVPNLEGSEAAKFLNNHGVTVFVLRYRTKEVAVKKKEPLWRRPVQDTQRALRLIRSRADEWKLKKDRIGLLAFSAGGQVGAIAHTTDTVMYEPKDDIDKLSAKPDFSMLVYPWRCLNTETNKLIEPIKITKDCGPAFIVHTHDDGSTAVGAAMLYIGLKQNKVPAELHIYQNGGHGYGVRPRENSVISTWPDRATEWLRIRKLIQ